MDVFLQLIKITSSSVEPSTDEKKKSKTFSTVMTILVFLLIFLPVALFVGFIVYALTTALMSYENLSIVPLGLTVMLHIVTVFSLVFGFNVVLSVFYFSSDLDYLLPLPISPIKIIGAKLTATMISENFMEAILVVSALIGFLLGYSSGEAGTALNATGILSSIIGVITFPVVPICYCAVICLILMYFTKFIKNKDNVGKVTSLSMLVLLIALVVFINVSGGFDTQAFAQQLLNGNLGVFSILDKIFFHVHFLSEAVAGNIVSLLNYILINVVCVAVVLALSSKLYFKAVIGLNGAQGKTAKKNTLELDKEITYESHTAAYVKKEFLILVRTPAFLTNCVGINLIWPIFIYLFIVLQSQSSFLDGYLNKLKNSDGNAVLTLMLVVFGVSVILTALNCIASSAITREGKHFEIMKYLPIDLMTQINSKALVSIIISGIGLIIYIIIAFVILGISPLLTLYSCALSILSVIFTAYLGIYLDTMNPKLVWEDEINALRGNYHVFFNMALALITTAVVCIVMKLLFKFEVLSLNAVLCLMMFITILLVILCYTLCRKKGVKNLMKIEM